MVTLLVERRDGFACVAVVRPGDGCPIFDPRFIEASREFTVAVWFYVMFRVDDFLLPDF